MGGLLLNRRAPARVQESWYRHTVLVSVGKSNRDVLLGFRKTQGQPALTLEDTTVQSQVGKERTDVYNTWNTWECTDLHRFRCTFWPAEGTGKPHTSALVQMEFKPTQSWGRRPTRRGIPA